MSSFLHEVQLSLKSLTNETPQIDKLVSLCIEKCLLQEFELSKLFQRNFIQGDSQIKTNIIVIIGQILIISHEKQLKSFTKVFAQKFKFFIDEIQHIQISSGMASSILIQIQKCQENKIFAPSFFQKIKGSSNKIAEKVQLVSLDGKYQLNYQKYSKTFLMKMQDVMAFKDLQSIYNTYCLYMEVENQLKPNSRLLSNNKNSQTFANSKEESEKIQNSPENLIQQIQKNNIHRNKMQQVITQCHVHIQNLRQKFKQQLKQMLNFMEQDERTQLICKMNEQPKKSGSYENLKNDKSFDSLVYPFDD